MPTHYQRLMLKNGFLVVLLGLVGGFFLIFSVLGLISLSPLPLAIDYQITGTASQWRAVHVGNLMNGLMAIIFGLALGMLELTEGAKKFVCYGTIAAVWGNAAFYVFGVFAPNRGLSLGGNTLGEGNWAGVLAFSPAFIGAFILIAVVIVMFRGLPK